MIQYDKIVFVCTGNTCRSPMAQAIYESLNQNPSLHAISRGLVVLFPEPANPKAEIVLNNHNLSLNQHVATQLSLEDLTENSLILTMTENQKKTVKEQYNFKDNVYTMKEFVGEMGDVIDPYGGSLVDYETCYSQIATLVKKTVYQLNEEKIR